LGLCGSVASLSDTVASAGIKLGSSRPRAVLGLELPKRRGPDENSVSGTDCMDAALAVHSPAGEVVDGGLVTPSFAVQSLCLSGVAGADVDVAPAHSGMWQTEGLGRGLSPPASTGQEVPRPPGAPNGGLALRSKPTDLTTSASTMEHAEDHDAVGAPQVSCLPPLACENRESLGAHSVSTTFGSPTPADPVDVISQMHAMSSLLGLLGRQLEERGSALAFWQKEAELARADIEELRRDRDELRTELQSLREHLKSNG